MITQTPRGMVYRCPVCGAEVAILARVVGVFEPRCCNCPMTPQSRRLVFYHCPVCGAEIAIIKEGEGVFEPSCCNEPMRRQDLAA